MKHLPPKKFVYRTIQPPPIIIPERSLPSVKIIERIGDYLKFVPKQLAEQLNCSVENLQRTIQQYINSYPNWENEIRKPSNYMLAVIKKRNIIYPSNICGNISLQLHIFGRIVGDMYIPNRKLCWSKDVFRYEYYFLEEEVLERTGKNKK